MGDAAETSATIREILLTSWPWRFAPEQLHDEVPLGGEGLGLDSIDIAELLLACEERTGRALTSAVFSELPLTIRRVAAYFSR
jgi:acyl carrier protein